MLKGMRKHHPAVHIRYLYKVSAPLERCQFERYIRRYADNRGVYFEPGLVAAYTHFYNPAQNAVAIIVYPSYPVIMEPTARTTMQSGIGRRTRVLRRNFYTLGKAGAVAAVFNLIMAHVLFRSHLPVYRYIRLFFTCRKRQEVHR